MVNYFTYKNNLKRKLFKNKAEVLLIWKHVLYNEKVQGYVRIKTMLYLQKLVNNHYKSHINRRCLISNNARTVASLNFSKSFFKYFLNKRVFTGFKKASW